MKNKFSITAVLFLLLFVMVCSPIINTSAAPYIQTLPPEDDTTETPTVEEISPYFSIEYSTLEDGTEISAYVVNGPSEPPEAFQEERAASILPSNGSVALPNFPSFSWVFGCGAVSGAMIAAYYDRNGYPNMYSGPVNAGIMPLSDTAWPTWKDSAGVTYPNNPLIASHKGIDGRTTRGTIEDYWVKYGSTAKDPYITNSWTQHAWGTAIGDYMKTSQSKYFNTDGSSVVYNYTTIASKLTCTYMETASSGYGTMKISSLDATYGRKLFYEARGYTVTDCYNQKTDNNGGGFTFANYKAQIDAGHPVFVHVNGHFMVGFGYSGTNILIRDTWDNNPSHTYSMPWGGSYLGMKMLSVGIVRLASANTPPAPPTNVKASDGTYTDKVSVSWTASTGAITYQVFRNTVNSHTGETRLVANHTASLYNDTSAVPAKTYYYWVKACNAAGCSGYSAVDSGLRKQEIVIPSAPKFVIASDGSYSDKVKITWGIPGWGYKTYLPIILSESENFGPIATPTYFQVFRNTSNTHTGETRLAANHLGSPYNDASAIPGTTYYYWVKACNAAGCSGYSTVDSGIRKSVAPSPPTNVSASDGTYYVKVEITWTASSGATYYKVFRNINNTHTGETTLVENHPASPYDDTSAVRGEDYYFWVKACNASGCSDYSSPDTGYSLLIIK